MDALTFGVISEHLTVKELYNENVFKTAKYLRSSSEDNRKVMYESNLDYSITSPHNEPNMRHKLNINPTLSKLVVNAAQTAPVYWEGINKLTSIMHCFNIFQQHIV